MSTELFDLAALRIEKVLSTTIHNEEPIIDFLLNRKDRLLGVVLFGGVVRDAFLDGISDSSDLDFVVLCNEDVLIKEFFQFSPTKNKFGGYRFTYGNRSIDIWALEDTWNLKREGGGGHTMMDLLRTTFFNVDSAYFNIYEKNIICSKNFLVGVKNRELGIINIMNPSSKSVVARVDKMKNVKRLTPDNMMKKYINSVKKSDKN